METTESPNPNQEVKSWFQKNRLKLFAGAIFLLTVLSVYFYQRYQMGKLRDQFNNAVMEKGELALQLAQHSNERLAEGMVKPLVWAIKSEMVRGNKEGIDRFITSIVQDSDLELIVIVDMTGMVYLSTDKKYEGKSVIEVLPTMPRDVLKAGVHTASPEEVVATAPILGDTQQLGVLYFTGKATRKMQDLVQELRKNPFAEPDAAKKEN